MTTVKELREIAQDILDQLEGMDDDQRLRVVGNTYFVDGFPMEVCDGFIDYENIQIEEDDDLDYEDEDE